jgi:hypothetical protein
MTAQDELQNSKLASRTCASYSLICNLQLVTCPFWISLVILSMYDFWGHLSLTLVGEPWGALRPRRCHGGVVCSCIHPGIY